MLDIGEKIIFTSIVDRDHFKFNRLFFWSVVVERVQRRWYVSCSFVLSWLLGIYHLDEQVRFVRCVIVSLLRLW